MKFGYAVIFVDDVRTTVEFYEQAFGLERGLITQSTWRSSGRLQRGPLRSSGQYGCHGARLFLEFAT
jgi:hypothetical protein